MPDQLVSDPWAAAAWRCSCGFFADGEPPFDEHLKAAANEIPEHFEVLEGWTLDQVRTWQATTQRPQTA